MATKAAAHKATSSRFDAATHANGAEITGSSDALSFGMPALAIRSDEQWMEIVGGGKAPFSMSIGIFMRELCFNLFLPFSIIFVKCFVNRPDIFLWNRQMIFFGFYRTIARDAAAAGTAPLPPETRFRRALIFLAEFARMIWVLGLRLALFVGFAAVLYIQELDENDIEHPWISYSYYPEITLTFVMMLIFIVLICFKWSFFPESFDEFLKRERAPFSILLNQQLMVNWSPSLPQTLSSNARKSECIKRRYDNTVFSRSRRNSFDDVHPCKLQR